MKSLSQYKKLLNENHALPLYYQLEQIIQNYLDSESINGGTIFFSEEEISEQLGVSRPTANKAIRSLIEKGILTRSRGKRSIVNSREEIYLVFLEELLSFGEMLKRQNKNYEYKTVLVDRQRIKASQRVAKHLNIENGADVVFLKRLRFINKEPVIVVDSYLSYEKFSKLLVISSKDFSTDLYQLMQELFGIIVHKAHREVTATRMALEDAELLKVEIWEPCLRLFAVAYDVNNIAFEYFDSKFKGTNCVLKTSLTKKSV